MDRLKPTTQPLDGFNRGIKGIVSYLKDNFQNWSSSNTSQGNGTG